MKTAKQLAEAARAVAQSHKTLYVLGCFGAPLTEENKVRWKQAYAYNRKAARSKKLAAADASTFGFDCVCFIKALLWGWSGDAGKLYGGASYASNGVPDIGEQQLIEICSGVSADFSRLQPGEVVWLPGHIGIYVGDGLVAEATPSWADGVQLTACNRSIPGYPRRDWKKHGKLPYLEYEPEERRPSVLQWQQAALADGFSFPIYGADGYWGAECEAVAAKAIVRKRPLYRYPNLTRLVQEVIGAEPDGLCGSRTDAAIRSWQEAHGLTPDGEAGLLTYRAMLGVEA